MEKRGNRILITFDQAGGGLKTFDLPQVRGFAIAGADRQFVWADAAITGKIRSRSGATKCLSPSLSDMLGQTIVCNLQSREGLPVTPFRTDDWPGVTADARR